MKRKLPKSQEPSLPQLEMPDLPGLPRNWDILLEYLRQRRYTSGDVHACIGVSRKVLQDWDLLGILAKLYQGLGSGRGDERFGKWRLYSIFDIWTLAFYKRLRDEGIDSERLLGMKQQAESSSEFEGEAIQWWFYQALPSWVHRHPFWVHSNRQGSLAHTSIERKSLDIYFIRIAHIEPSKADLFLTLNLLPLMDKAMALSGPLELSVDKAKGVVIRVEGEELRLEPLPKPD
jgi:hypothetical protein